MKKVLKYLLPVIFIAILCYLGIRMINIKQQQQIRNKNIEHIPLFTLKEMSGKIFTNENLKKNIPVIFFYFNTECDFCQAEIEDVSKNIQKFKGVQLLFVSFEDIQEIKEFQTGHKLDVYDNVVFLCDYKNSFYDMFGIDHLPSSIVYDKHGNLLSRNNAAVKVDYILKVLK